MERSGFTAFEIVQQIWAQLNLPPEALSQLELKCDGSGMPSSFKIGHLAQASIALSALAAAICYANSTGKSVPRTIVPRHGACFEFKSERLYQIEGQNPPSSWGPIGGLHKTSDGYVRIHDNFPHHRDGALTLLGCQPNATRDDVARAAKHWCAIDVENAAADAGLPIYALRTPEQWDVTPQARAISSLPIILRKLDHTNPRPYHRMGNFPSKKCLSGIRVLELSRVIAAPVAGRTLAAHGADVLWVTSPSLPDLPALDRELARGKRTIQLDLNDPAARQKLTELAREADVFIQSYRPGALANKGFSIESLVGESRNGIVIGDLSAFGSSGPWSQRRGFDSLVQTCSGMNVSEAEHFGEGQPARPMPCQALDHGAGYFLASGIAAALYKRATEGGSYHVEVSLAGVMKYLRSLGEYEGKTGFDCRDFHSLDDVPEDLIEERESGFGRYQFLKHTPKIEGLEVGWEVMPKKLGTDEARWL